MTIKSLPVLVLLVAGALLAVLAALVALMGDPNLWRVGQLAVAAVVLIWTLVVVRKQWRARG